MNDGGQAALSGFLYQIIGMLSIVATAHNKVDSLKDEEEITSLLTMQNVGKHVGALHEWLGQDAVFSAGDQCVLVQFKYSAVDDKIDTGELNDIIKKLRFSAERASESGLHVTACVLFTNRELTSRGGAAKALFEEEQKKPSSYALRYYRSKSTEVLTRQLESLGRQYGLFDAEIQRGINVLVGKTLIETDDPIGIELTYSDMLAAFTGHRNTQKLTVSSVTPYCQQALKNFESQIDVQKWEEMLVERSDELIEDILEAIVGQQRALIGIYGPGGCGKSTLVWQLLQQLSGTYCYTLEFADSISNTWIKDTLHRWRGLEGFPNSDTREEILNRLAIANPGGSPPLLWLALDGLDEGLSNDKINQGLRDLLKWFWQKDRERFTQPSTATLLVTYRNKDSYVDRLAELLQLKNSDAQELCVFPVDDFTDEELEKAANIMWPELSVMSISDIGNMTMQLFDKPMREPSVKRTLLDSFPSPVNKSVIESLHHPAMWSALLSLDKPSREKAIIVGESQYTHKLAHAFIVEWFVYKLHRRDSRGLFQDLISGGCIELLDILTQVVHNSELANNHRDDNWISPARETDIGISREEARQLYVEALSAGLIIETSCRNWRWRHGIVYEYLKAREQGETW